MPLKNVLKIYRKCKVTMEVEIDKVSEEDLEALQAENIELPEGEWDPGQYWWEEHHVLSMFHRHVPLSRPEQFWQEVDEILAFKSQDLNDSIPGTVMLIDMNQPVKLAIPKGKIVYLDENHDYMYEATNILTESAKLVLNTEVEDLVKLVDNHSESVRLFTKYRLEALNG